MEDLSSDLRYAYTIAFSMRSGSNELCNLLTRNGIGRPSEFFQGWATQDQATAPKSFDDFSHVVSEHQQNGIFGSKMSHDHRARVDASLASNLPDYSTLSDVLPNHRWIWLVRRDKIGQAISLCRAEKSGVWARGNSDAVERDPWEFDFFEILAKLMSLLVNDFAWEAYFRSHVIDPYKIVYEDFFSDTGSGLESLLKFLDPEPSQKRNVEMDLNSTLIIQRDSLSEELHSKFLKYLNSIGSFDMLKEFGESSLIWSRFFSERQWRPTSDAA